MNFSAVAKAYTDMFLVIGVVDTCPNSVFVHCLCSVASRTFLSTTSLGPLVFFVSLHTTCVHNASRLFCAASSNALFISLCRYYVVLYMHSESSRWCIYIRLLFSLSPPFSSPDQFFGTDTIESKTPLSAFSKTFPVNHKTPSFNNKHPHHFSLHAVSRIVLSLLFRHDGWPLLVAKYHIPRPPQSRHEGVGAHSSKLSFAPKPSSLQIVLGRSEEGDPRSPTSSSLFPSGLHKVHP